MKISNETIYISSAAAAGIAVALFLSAWSLGRFYRLGRLRRAAPYLAGLVLAAASGAFMHLLFNTLFVSIPVSFIAGVAGFTAALWFLSSAREPASFGRLFGVGAYMFLYFNIVSTAVGLLTYAMISYITAPKDMILQPPPPDMYAQQVADRLRKLYSAQSIFKTRKEKYGTLDELTDGNFFERDFLSVESTGYVIEVEVSEKKWRAIAVPSGDNAGLPGLRIDETGLVRYTKDGRAPSRSDPIYK